MASEITYDRHGNALRTCWRCGEKNGIHRVRCVECDAHRALAPQNEGGE